MRRCMLSKSQAQFRGECCLPVPRESVACSRTLYLSTCPTKRNQGVKGKVYVNKPRTLTALEDNICRQIGLVTSTTYSVAVKHVCIPTAITSRTRIESIFLFMYH